jgi:PAS domain-containing protein
VEVFRACREQIAGLGLRGGLSLLDETGERLIVRASAFPEWMLKTLADLERRTGRSVEGFAFTAAKVEAYREVIETGQAVFVQDSSTVILQMLPEAAQPLAGPILKVFGTPPAIFAPLISEGRARGVLNIVGADLTPDDVPAVAAFANHLAVALDNARLFAGLHNAEERFRTVVNNLPIILWALDGAGGFTLSEGQSLERLGLKPGEVVGRSVFEVYRLADDSQQAGRQGRADQQNERRPADPDRRFG